MFTHHASKTQPKMKNIKKKNTQKVKYIFKLLCQLIVLRRRQLLLLRVQATKRFYLFSCPTNFLNLELNL